MVEKIETEQLKQDEAMGLLESRRSMYAFLARVYGKEVSVDFLKQCMEKDGPLIQLGGFENTDEEGEADKEIADGFGEMSNYLKGAIGKDIAEAKLQLDIEYANLFLGIIGKPPHPSESVYTSENHLLMQEPRDEVMFAYRSVGVDKVEGFTEPEDHVAIELQFMAYLCQKTIDAMRSGDHELAKRYLNIQLEFVVKHLSVWIPALTKDIIQGGKIGFYTGAARITNGFVKTEQQSIEFLLEQFA